MLASLKSRAQALKTETYALYLAARDPRTPWLARILVFLVVAYALSPIDLIPDFVPILGYLDDLIIVPGGIALALKLIPRDVMEQSRQRARAAAAKSRVGVLGAVIIVIIWICASVFAFRLVYHVMTK